MRSIVSSLLNILLLMLAMFYTSCSSRTKSIEYNGEEYQIKNSELGVMIYRGNAGDFKVNRSFENNRGDILLLKVYEFQERRDLWFRIVNNRAVKVDSSSIKFSKFKEIPIDLLIR